MTIVLAGKGLHRGEPGRVTVHPRPPGSGLVFRRVDVRGQPTIPATPDHLLTRPRHTCLCAHGVTVATVEHLLAACHVLGLWDLEFHVEGDEIPILDGSARPFLEALGEVPPPDSPPDPLVVTRPLTCQQGPQRATLYPAATFSLRCTIDFDHPAVGRQTVTWNGERDRFEQDFAAARTFGFLQEVEALRRRGLAQGGSLDNALVFGDGEPLTPLRLPQEPARHKLLDAVGDLALLGRPLLGACRLERPSHALTARLLHQLQAQGA